MPERDLREVTIEEECSSLLAGLDPIGQIRVGRNLLRIAKERAERPPERLGPVVGCDEDRQVHGKTRKAQISVES